MARSLRYADALRMLGTDDSAVLDFAENLVDGGLGLLGVPDLGGLRTLILEHGRAALAQVRDRITGTSRYDRTQRIAAAQEIIAVTAFFDALGELLDGPDSPLSLADLEITAEEQQLVLDHDGVLFLAPDDGLHVPHFDSHPLLRFVSGLAAWDRLDDRQRGRVTELLQPLPELAERRYQETYRRLAADVPEFGVWANHAQHHATQTRVDELTTGLAGLEHLLAESSTGAQAERRGLELAALYRRALDRPVLNASEAPEGFTLPALRDAYLNPRGRVAVHLPGSNPAIESWWEGWTVRTDIQATLATLLTRPEATQRPIVVLGHPGAGKSMLSSMLAARLPPQDFLPVRVELRTVPADAPIHRQIEQAVSDTLHSDTDWRDLAESAGGALPVVILDGLDELLQATGVNRSDYLERVQEFQQTQETLGRPVVVIVTSRTVVVDRIRFPVATSIIRLEPFDDTQIARMVDIWNRANADGLRTRGLDPVDAATVLRHRDLAEQPLLLLMLLLYDAGGNALQRARDGLSRANLYERLLTSFAEREVRKHNAHLDGDALRAAVAEELRRLEVTALAMFARRQQSITAEELDSDLAVLASPLPDAASDAGLRGRLSGADRMLGRFFFIHESRAQQGTERSTYEFLHATFGEYLMARMVASTLDDLVAVREFNARRHRPEPLDDGLLYALTSFVVLASRTATVEFLDDILSRRCAEQAGLRAEYRSLLLTLFQEAPYPPENRSYGQYRPRRVPIVARQAVYSANLVVLLVLVSEEPINIVELLPEDDVPLEAWTTEANLWRGPLGRNEWFGLLDTVRVRHLGWADGRPRTILSRERGTDVDVGECLGFELLSETTEPLTTLNPYGVTVPAEHVTARVLRSIALRVNGTAARLALILLPYLVRVGGDLVSLSFGTTEVEDAKQESWLPAHDLLAVWLTPVGADPRTGEDAPYVRLLDSTVLGVQELLVIQRLAEDVARRGENGSSGTLREVAEEFLTSVETVSDEVRHDPRALRRVLDALRPHLNVNVSTLRLRGEISERIVPAERPAP